MTKRTIDDVISSVGAAGGECVVLMGAGCSRSSGIPMASELIREIKEKYPTDYQRAERNVQHSGKEDPPNYNEVMSELSLVNRHALFDKYMYNAKVNWAHLALAKLFETKKINRVLTVNFDHLLIKACSMVNFYPAVYDIAASQDYKKDRIAPSSVIYLNGQHSGFVTLNAEDELLRHKRKLELVVGDTGVKRVWLVIGYSGEADPLLEVLANQDVFDADLYWLGHSSEPSEHLVKSGLFDSGKKAFYVGGQDADSCLATIAETLDCFPPDLLHRPITHILSVWKTVNFDTEVNSTKPNRDRLFQQLVEAQKQYEPDSIEQASLWMHEGAYEKVCDWYESMRNPSAEQGRLVSLVYLAQGNKLNEEALSIRGADREAALAKWDLAVEKYKLALEANADMYAAANNWANVLNNKAKTLIDSNPNTVEIVRAFWHEAYEKYKLANLINPNVQKVVYNWGGALANEAQALTQFAHDLNMSDYFEGAQRRINEAVDLIDKHTKDFPESFLIDSRLLGWLYTFKSNANDRDEYATVDDSRWVEYMQTEELCESVIQSDEFWSWKHERIKQ